MAPTDIPQPELGEFSTPSQLAAVLQIPEPTLAQWRHRKIGPRYTRMGRHVRYRKTDVLAWIDAQAVATR